MYNIAGVEVKTPYSSRDDVGTIGILAGNWGGNRANLRLQERMDRDLKAGPATMICLQEAHAGLEEILESPAVAGGEDTPALLGRFGKPAQYLTLRADEEGINTNLIAVRANVA